MMFVNAVVFFSGPWTLESVRMRHQRAEDYGPRARLIPTTYREMFERHDCSGCQLHM